MENSEMFINAKKNFEQSRKELAKIKGAKKLSEIGAIDLDNCSIELEFYEDELKSEYVLDLQIEGFENCSFAFKHTEVTFHSTTHYEFSFTFQNYGKYILSSSDSYDNRYFDLDKSVLKYFPDIETLDYFVRIFCMKINFPEPGFLGAKYITSSNTQALDIKKSKEHENLDGKSVPDDRSVLDDSDTESVPDDRSVPCDSESVPDDSESVPDDSESVPDDRSVPDDSDTRNLPDETNAKSSVAEKSVGDNEKSDTEPEEEYEKIDKKYLDKISLSDLNRYIDNREKREFEKFKMRQLKNFFKRCEYKDITISNFEASTDVDQSDRPQIETSINFDINFFNDDRYVITFHSCVCSYGHDEQLDEISISAFNNKWKPNMNYFPPNWNDKKAKKFFKEIINILYDGDGPEGSMLNHQSFECHFL